MSSGFYDMKNPSGLSVRIRHSLFGLRAVWEKICSKNSRVLPLQCFDYYKCLFLSFYAKHLISRWRILFYHLSDGKEDCIIPLVVNHKRRAIRGLSNFGRLDYEDVISSTEDASFVRNCLEMVLNGYKGYSLHLININESSMLYKALGDRMKFLENCVTIDIPSDFEEYISGLSKHQRQNIRTAYNRLSKESFDVCLKHYDENTRIPRRLWQQCQQMYEGRHSAPGSRYKIWIERQRNPYTRILHSVKGWQVFVLFHNETPISYMAGLSGKVQNCYYVPRLCIDSDFIKYSPGIILLVETIRQIINQGIGHLDLMLGDEPYKTAMGGRVHQNFELKCKVDELLG